MIGPAAVHVARHAGAAALVWRFSGGLRTYPGCVVVRLPRVAAGMYRMWGTIFAQTTWWPAERSSRAPTMSMRRAPVILVYSPSPPGQPLFTDVDLFGCGSSEGSAVSRCRSPGNVHDHVGASRPLVIVDVRWGL